jgi:hypothetical protein
VTLSKAVLAFYGVFRWRFRGALWEALPGKTINT